MTSPDPFDQLLAGAPYLPDEGFTEQVMARLPPPRRDPRARVLGLAGLAAAALAAATLPEALRSLAAALPATWLLSPPLLASWLCAGGALGYATSALLGGRAQR